MEGKELMVRGDSQVLLVELERVAHPVYLVFTEPKGQRVMLVSKEFKDSWGTKETMDVTDRTESKELLYVDLHNLVNQ